MLLASGLDYELELLVQGIVQAFLMPAITILCATKGQ
jgi:hypothetical protein